MRPITYYVLEPRDEPCSVVNPPLWQEFVKYFGELQERNVRYFTEAFCVQWLDQYYELGVQGGTAEEHTHTA